MNNSARSTVIYILRSKKKEQKKQKKKEPFQRIRNFNRTNVRVRGTSYTIEQRRYVNSRNDLFRLPASGRVTLNDESITFLSLSLSLFLSLILLDSQERCSLDNKDFRLDFLLFRRLYADNGRFSPASFHDQAFVHSFSPEITVKYVSVL